MNNKIKEFYVNILNILGILIAVFSIIGFNIGGIKFIVGKSEKLNPWEYAGSIGIVNFCIICSVYFLFFLINKIINRNKDSTFFSIKMFIIMIIIFSLIIGICFIKA